MKNIYGLFLAAAMFSQGFASQEEQGIVLQTPTGYVSLLSRADSPSDPAEQTAVPLQTQQLTPAPRYENCYGRCFMVSACALTLAAACVGGYLLWYTPQQ